MTKEFMPNDGDTIEEGEVHEGDELTEDEKIRWPDTLGFKPVIDLLKKKSGEVGEEPGQDNINEEGETDVEPEENDEEVGEEDNNGNDEREEEEDGDGVTGETEKMRMKRHGGVGDEKWKKLSRGERREKLRKSWEDMTEIERHEYYVLNQMDEALERLKVYEEHKEQGLHEKMYSKNSITRFDKLLSMDEYDRILGLKDKYDSRLLRLERQYALESARANYLVANREVRRRFSVRRLAGRGKNILKWRSKGKEQRQELLDARHIALYGYNNAEQRTIFNSTLHICDDGQAHEMRKWLVMNERMRLSEAEGLEQQRGLFEKTKKTLRALSDFNVYNYLRHRDRFMPDDEKRAPKGALAKRVGRMVSGRLVVGFGLLGAAAALGSGTMGLSALAGRRVLSGASASFGFYDVLRNYSDKKALSDVTEEDVEKMTPSDIERKMAELEIRSKFAGERMLRSQEYSILQKEYLKQVSENLGLTEEQQLESMISSGTDTSVFDTEERKLFWKDILRKFTGVGMGVTLGLIFAELFSSGEEGVAEAGGPDVKGADHILVKEGTLHDVNEPEIDLKSYEYNLAQDAATIDVADLPEPPGYEPSEFLAEKGELSVDGLEDTLHDINEPQINLISDESNIAQNTAIIDVENLPEPSEYIPPEFLEVEVISGSVEQGGSVSKTINNMVESGVITQEQANEAFNSNYSMINLEGGEKIHISKLGLVHEGDRVVYVPETSEAPAHFAVNPESGYNYGSNQDLHDAMIKEGIEVPQWLKNALDHGAGEAGEVEEVLTIPEDIGEPIIDIGAEEYDIAQDVAQADVENLPEPHGYERTEVLGELKEDAIEGIDEPLNFEPPEEALNVIEVLEAASEGSLKASERAIDTKWGDFSFVYNGDGEIAGYILKETANASYRDSLISEASDAVLRRNFDRVLERGIHEAFQHSELPFRIREAKEGAWEIFRLLNVMESGVKDGGAIQEHSAEFYYLRHKINELVEDNNADFGRIFSISRYRRLLS